MRAEPDRCDDCHRPACKRWPVDQTILCRGAGEYRELIVRWVCEGCRREAVDVGWTVGLVIVPDEPAVEIAEASAA